MAGSSYQTRRRPSPHRDTPDELPHASWLEKARIGDERDGGAQINAVPEYFASTHGRRRPSSIATSLLRQQAGYVARLERAADRQPAARRADVPGHRVLRAPGAVERASSRPPLHVITPTNSHSFVKLSVSLTPGAMREMAQPGDRASRLVMPSGTLAAWVFYSMEQIGDLSEGTFGATCWAGAPTSSPCRRWPGTARIRRRRPRAAGRSLGPRSNPSVLSGH